MTAKPVRLTHRHVFRRTGRALEAHQIYTSAGRLVSETVGEIEREGNVLVIRRISVHYRLRAPESVRETVE